MRSRLPSILRILVPIALLLLCLAAVDVSRAWALLSGASIVHLAAALGLVQVQIVLAALRWWLTARSLGQRLGIMRAVREYYGASLLNLVLPGGVSGDIVRVARNRTGDGDGDGDGRGWERSVQSVVLERASGQLAFALVALPGGAMLLATGAVPSPPLLALGTLLVLALGVLLAFALGRSPRPAAFSRRFAQAALLAFARPFEAACQLGLSLAVVLAYIAAFFLCARAVGSELTAFDAFAVVPPILLAMLLPVSVGGWGVREGAAAALFPLVGQDPAAGVAASVLYGLV